MVTRLQCLAPLLVMLVVGSGDDAGRGGTTKEAPLNDRAQLRARHAGFLDLQPGVEDLTDSLRGVANACRLDESHSVCRWGRENLSDEKWKRIRAAWAEDDRRGVPGSHQANKQIIFG